VKEGDLTPSAVDTASDRELTVAFTDVEGSTRLWERFPKHFGEVIAHHQHLLATLAESHSGRVVKYLGDGVMVVFDDCTEAVRWAVVALMRTSRECVLPSGECLAVRVGLHCGPVEASPIGQLGTDFYGIHVNRAARICQSCRGGDVLLSDLVWDKASQELGPDFRVEPLGYRSLAGITTPAYLYRLYHEQLPKRAETVPRRAVLPGFLTPLIGRGELVRTLIHALTENDARLITLLGPGGIGKTRVAVRVAQEAVGHFHDGVYYADLAEVESPDDLPPALLQALGLSHLEGVEPLDQLCGHLAGKCTLIVLDGFERLVQDTELLVRLLGVSEGARCLITSRLALRVVGEQVIAVPPLCVPEPEMSMMRLDQVPSVALFCHLARLRAPRWELSERIAQAVAELCRRLDGIPLALELAAAKLDVFSIEEVAAQLRDGLGVLSTAGWQRPERQRTLEAAIRWSYERLSGPAQAALQQACVFHGGFGWWAFEQTAPVDEPLQVLEELCWASLLARQNKAGSTRYVALEPIRDFARQQMQPEQESAARLRHAAYFLEFAQRRAEAAHTLREIEAFEEMDEESNNLLAAVHWLGSEGSRAELTGRMVLAMSEHLTRRGRWKDRSALLRRAYELAAECKALDDTEWGLRVAYELASAAYDAGELGEAERVVTQALEASRRIGQVETQARCLNLVGLLAQDQGRVEEARAAFTQALELWEQLGQLRGRGVAHSNLGNLALGTQGFEAARREFVAGLDAWEECGDSVGQCLALNNLGVVAEKQGDLDRAEGYYREAAQRYLQLGDRLGLAVAVNNLGEIAAQRNQVPRAVALVAAARDELAEIGSPLSGICATTLAELAVRCTPEEFQEAEAAGRQRPPGEWT